MSSQPQPVVTASGKPRGRTLVARSTAVSLLVLAGLVLAVPAANAHQHGDYTQAQARRGAHVFAKHCAVCHGAHLQGQEGPALAGPAWKGSLEFSKISALQLFQFISTQMPRSDPGSLKQQQYEDALAYILSKNGYPSGDVPLGPSSLKHIKLLPYPGVKKTQSSHQ